MSERKLILHADDLGVARSINRASFEALAKGWVSSASVVMVGAEVAEVAIFRKKAPTADLGVHLTLTSESRRARWAPLANPARVKSLLASDGCFPRKSAEALRRARPVEIEREFSAQIERALELGLKPSHLDCHRQLALASPRVLSALRAVSRAYKLPYLAFRRYNLRPAPAGFRRHASIDLYYAAPPSLESYRKILSELPPGTHQLELHLGRDDAELRGLLGARGAWGSVWRERDFKLVSSRQFRQALKSEGIRLAGWAELGSRDD